MEIKDFAELTGSIIEKGNFIIEDKHYFSIPANRITEIRQNPVWKSSYYVNTDIRGLFIEWTGECFQITF